ncbi:MAG: aminoglycoside 6-adenylyltransferase, partial [Finegoldia magna]|nr:aminoglycoside 6-adenylyltransferase [Finegoldia magna]
MVNNIKNKVISFSNENEEVRSLIETGRRLNPSIEKDENTDYHFVFGVTD